MENSEQKDGVNCINVYSRGTTILGRVMSHFYPAQFSLPGYGTFATVEGFWHYLGSGCIHDEFRHLNGYDCKKQSKQYPKAPMDEDEFKRLIKEANLAKFRQNPKLQYLLVRSHLPFTHYYDYGGKIIRPNQHDWVINMYEEVRSILKKETGMA